MSEVILIPDQFYNCPICNQKCQIDEVEAWDTLHRQGMCQQFSCTTPLVENPLHYYVHIVDKSEPNRIAYQEFTIDIGVDTAKYVFFGLNFNEQKTIIKNGVHAPPLELDFVIVPDYPNCILLKKQIRTAITFS